MGSLLACCFEPCGMPQPYLAGLYHVIGDRPGYWTRTESAEFPTRHSPKPIGAISRTVFHLDWMCTGGLSCTALWKYRGEDLRQPDAGNVASRSLFDVLGANQEEKNDPKSEIMACCAYHHLFGGGCGGLNRWYNRPSVF